MDFQYSPTTSIKLEKGIAEDPYFQKLYDNKTIIVSDLTGEHKGNLALILPGISEMEDVTDKKNTTYSIMSTVFFFLAVLCFPSVVLTEFIDNTALSGLYFVIAIICLLAFSTLGITTKEKIKNYKIVNNVLVIPSSLLRGTRSIPIIEKELIPTINSIVARNNLEEYYSIEKKGKIQALLHSDNKIFLQSIIIQSINFSLKTGEWEATDKIIGACCELEKTSSISLIKTLYKGIVLNYWLIINSPQLEEEYSLAMDEIDNINNIKHWEEILGLESF